MEKPKKETTFREVRKVWTHRDAFWEALLVSCRKRGKFRFEETRLIASAPRNSIGVWFSALRECGYVKAVDSCQLSVVNGQLTIGWYRLVPPEADFPIAPRLVREKGEYFLIDYNLDPNGVRLAKTKTVSFVLAHKRRAMEWLKELDREVKKNGQANIARALGVSPTTIHHIRKGEYQASTRRIREKFNRYMETRKNEVVECPVMGKTDRGMCESERGGSPSDSMMAAALYEACGSCKNAVGD